MALEMETTKLSEFIGCEVRNFDVWSLSDAASFARFQTLIDAHHVLVFRDQNLAPDQLLAFTRLLGEIDGTHVQSEFTLPDYPDIYVISNTKSEDGRPVGTPTVGHHWHTDWAYKAFPASYTLLYGVEVPAQPHHTLFASQKRVYDLLTEEEKANLRGRTASYSYAKTHNAKKWLAPITEEQKAKTPTVSHPMLRIHPSTGKEGLYINRADCVGVNGMSEEEGLALVHGLIDRIIEPDFIYAHEWKPRDLVIWDNRVLLHAATPYDMTNDRRLIHRTTTKGERPIAADATLAGSVAA